MIEEELKFTSDLTDGLTLLADTLVDIMKLLIDHQAFLVDEHLKLKESANE